MKFPNTSDNEVSPEDLLPLDQTSKSQPLEDISFLRGLSNIIRSRFQDPSSPNILEPEYHETESEKLAKEKKSESESMDRSFLLKVLSSVQNGIDNTSEVNKMILEDFQDTINRISAEFSTERKVNYSLLKSLINEITALKNDDGERVLKIEDEEDVITAVDNKAMSELSEAISSGLHELASEFIASSGLESTDSSKQLLSGTLSISKFIESLDDAKVNTDQLKKSVNDALSVNAIVDHKFKEYLGDRYSELNPDQKKDIDSNKKLYSEGAISREFLVESLKKVMNPDESVVLDEKLTQFNAILQVIADNTNPKKDQLTNADLILEKNRQDLQLENDKKLGELLGKIDSNDNEKIKGLLDGVNTAEDAGRKLGDKMFGNTEDSQSLLEDIWDKASGKGKKGGAKIPGAKGKVPWGKVAKGAGIVGAVTTAGLAAYNYSQAESDQERKASVGEGVGGVAGSLAGAKVGALAGGAIGSFVPVVGTAAGAAVGGVIGAAAGAFAGTSLGNKVAGWFSGPEDLIPDMVTKQGPVQTLDYVDRILIPQLKNDIATNPKSEYKPSDVTDLIEYRNKLAKDKLDKAITDLTKLPELKDMSSHNKLKEIQSYYSQLSYENPALYNEVMKSAGSTLKVSAPTSPYTPRSGSSGGSSTSSTSSGIGGSFTPEAPLGSISEKYESGGRGVSTVSSGKGDAGGVSYGKYQLASKTGTMDSFLNSKEGAAYKDRFAGLKAGSSEFSQVYSQIAKSEGDKFSNAQHDYIQRTHYEPVAAFAEKSGINVKNPAIREALWSMSVQHSYTGNKKIITNMIQSGVDLKDDKAVINGLYGARSNYASQFANSSATVNRYNREVNDVLAMNNSLNNTPTNSTVAKSPVSPTDSKSSSTTVASTDTNVSKDDEKLNFYMKQGMNDPGQLAIATGLPIDYIKTKLNGGSSVMKSASGDVAIDKADFKKKIDSASATALAPQPIIIKQPGSNKSNDFRLSDTSLLVASVI